MEKGPCACAGFVTATSEHKWKAPLHSIQVNRAMLAILCLLVALCHGSEWVIQLKEGVAASDFARQNHLHYVGPFEVMPRDENYHIFRVSRARSAAVRSSEQVRWSEEQQRRPRVVPRAIDPMYANQWHLHGSPWGIDADRVPANLTGKGVTIAIVDDGLQHIHPEISPNYAAAHSYNYNDPQSDDPAPHPDDDHGTAAAGVAVAAKDNGYCGRGVAPGAKVSGIRLIADAVTDMTEATALTLHAMSDNDIFSCSWGPDDDGHTMAGPGFLTERAMALYAGQLRGRLGRGSIYVWAAGNGRDNGDSCAFDGYASSPFAFAIGAIDNAGKRAWYSEGCAALLAVAPSSGNGGGIVTSDLLGPNGYSPTDCTDRFGGTSAAAPMAAGVIALMLQKRPELTWRDVKHIIARAAVPINQGDGSWHINAAGFHHSHEYGFGLLKLLPLLEEVGRHTLLPPQYRFWTTGMRIIQAPTGFIPYTFDVAVNGTGIQFIEHVQLTCSLDHTSRGSVTITLQSPQGTISRMADERAFDRGRNYPAGGWTFTSVRHWGETRADGVWRVVVGDTNPRTAGKNHFHGYVLNIMGH